MKKQIIITGDVNDGDYITQITEIKYPEEELLVRKVANVIGKKGHNWADDYDDWNLNTVKTKYSDKLSDTEIDEFDDFLPSHEECQIHTISSIIIIEIANEIELLE